MAMKAEEALAIAKSYTKKSLEGQGALRGEDGVSPVISVNTSTADTYKLDITDKNGTITTPNLVGKQGERGEVGETGADGETPTITENADNTEEVYKLDFTTKNGTFTTKNIIGKQGLEGVSPSVTTNPDNTAEDYRLNITTKGGTFTTPNLRGPQGEIGPQGESAASAINPRGDYDVNADPHYTVSDYITSAEGNTYVCKKDNPDNVAPTDGTINDEFWQVLALRGAKGESGKDGEKGADGVTFTPSIDANGVLSFTNNGGLENPEPIDIKGDNGVTFTPSIDTDGYLSFTNDGNLENPEPIKVLGKDGKDGKDGIDGTTYIPSIGTVTTVESNADASAGVTVDEETKEAVFHFEIPKGEDGFSPIVETVESENGHTVNITDVKGVKSFEVLNGKDGVQIDDTTTSTDTVWSSKKTSDEIDALISDTTSSTASTYSSKKIDEIANGIVIPASTATRYIKFTLRNYTKADVITVADNYGGKIEILGTHDSAYKIPKVIRYSYGDWNTYDATTNQNYKIGGLYQYSTENVYYLEIKSNTTISIQGLAITPEIVTELPVATSEMTLIPESKYASINDSSTSKTSTWSSKKTSDEIAKVETKLKLINLGDNVDANNCRIEDRNINGVYGYCGLFTQNVPKKDYAEIRCYHYGSGIKQFIDYTSKFNTRTYTRFIQYDGNSTTDWQELATMDKLGGLTFSASGTTLTITNGTNTWTLEANS